MSWFDILKVYDPQNPFGTGKPKHGKERSPVSSEFEEKIEEEKIKYITSPDKKLYHYSEGAKKPNIESRTSLEEIGQTGDEGKLNIQQATRQLQRQTRGQYQKIADEITQLGLDSRVNTKDQKKILGRIRRRLREENITEA